MLSLDPQQATVVAATDSGWRSLELSSAYGQTNTEPAAWRLAGFDDAAWSAAYVPPDANWAWADIAGADYLSSTGRATGHLGDEIWIARREFTIAGPIAGDGVLVWNVDGSGSVWVNGNRLLTNTGEWQTVHTTSIPAAMLHAGTNAIAVEVWNGGVASNTWETNPTMFQANLYACDPGCDQDDPAGEALIHFQGYPPSVPSPTQWLPWTHDGTYEWWHAWGPTGQPYVSRSANPIDITLTIGKYLGPTDPFGHLLPDNSLYDGDPDATVALFVQAWDVDSSCGSPPCELDTVAVNGIPVVKDLEGYNNDFHTTELPVLVSSLVFRKSYLDTAGGVNHVQIMVDQSSSTDTWYAGVLDISLRLPPAPEIYRPTVLIHGIFGQTPDLDPYRKHFHDESGVPADAILEVIHDSQPIDVALPLIEAQIDGLVTASGWDRANIVAHSLGGLYARAYAWKHWAQVKTVVTIGTPNGGIPAEDALNVRAQYDPRWVVPPPTLLEQACMVEPVLCDLTADAVRNQFNPKYLDRPSVAYWALAGNKRSPGGCPFAKDDQADGDGCVTVESAQWMTVGKEGNGTELTRDPYWVTHFDEMSNLEIIGNVDCLLFHGCLTPNAPDGGTLSASAGSPASGVSGLQVAAVASVTVPAGGSLDLPVTFEGASSAAVFAVGPGGQIGAAIAGTTLDPTPDWPAGLLTASLSVPADQPLHITNSGQAPAEVSVVVEIATDRSLAVDATAFVNRGSPVSVTVNLAGSLPGDVPTAALFAADGTSTPIALSPSGTDAWTGSVTPTAAGASRILASVGGARPRFAGVSVDIGSGASWINPSLDHAQEGLVDSDGDGFANGLEVGPYVRVGVAGTYTLTGRLVDLAGTEVGVASASATLAANAPTPVYLDFDGTAIHASALGGPYRLADLRLFSDNSIEAVTERTAPTLAYSIDSFQHAAVAFDSDTFAGTPLDDNGDGLMDRWRVSGSATVDAVGTYTIESGLAAADGTTVVSASETVPLAAGANAFALDFDGATILASGHAGPYLPADFTVQVADRTQVLSSYVVSSPAYAASTAGSVTLPVRVSMPAGSGTVEVWQRFEAEGTSGFGPWTLASSSQLDSGTRNITVPIASSLGTYEFYSVAVDGASLVREAAPASADTSTGVATAPSLSLSFANNYQNSHDFMMDYWASYPSGSGWASLSMQTSNGWVEVAEAAASPFSVHVDADGTYYFSAVGCDGLTDLRSASSGKYLNVDTVPPVSSAGPVPAATTSTSLSIPYAASDTGSGIISHVEVWQRVQVAGSSTWSDWSMAASGSASPIAVMMTSGSGRYEFYSVAVDIGGNREAPPDVADAFTVLDAPPATVAGPLPAAVHLTMLSVPYTGTDDPTVELWQRFEAAGSTTFNAWATVATGATSPFSVPLTSGDGRYEFYTIGTKGEVREAEPGAADTFTVRDTVVPTSAIGSVQAAVKTATPSVPYTASDNANGSGLAPVEIWQRFEAAGSSTWSAWAMVTTATHSPVAVPLASGDGRYEFYAVAVDTAGNRETAPASADAFTVLDTAAPSTAASALPAVVKSTTLSVPFTATDGGGSGLTSIELWQRFRAAGSGTWSSWTKKSTVIASPFSLTLASGNGSYEFYSVGVDAAGNREGVPATADTSTVLDSVAPVSAAAALPASVSSPALSVPFTASDTNGSGVTSVELWQRFQAAGSGTWSGWASVTSGPSSPFSVTLGSGDGRYEFYTVGIDVATNREAAPASADAFTVLATTPVTAASALSTPVRTTSISVAYTATLSASVELWRRYRVAGSPTWSAWSLVTTVTTSPISTTLPSGDGRYEFYTIGISAGGIREAAPASADTYTDLDTGSPTSTVGSVPSTSSAASFEVPFTAADTTNGTGIASTELWARYRPNDSVSTGTWTLVASGTGTSGSITLPFASGAGIYDLATIAVDLAGNREGGLTQPSAAKSLVRSISWGASVKVNTDTGSALQDNPACALGPDGTAYCVWEDSRSGNADIEFAQRNPSTGVWSGEMKLNTDTGSKAQTTPAIAVDGAGNLYVVWADERNTVSTANTDVYFTKRSGSTWSANTMLNADATTSVQSQPRIGVSSAGIAVAVWLDLRSSQKNIYSARLPAGSSTWSANYKVTSNTAATKGRPDVAVATDGTAHAVWEDATSGNADIDYATLASGGTTWSTNAKISDDATSGAESFPRIGLTLANAPLVAWIDGRTTNKQVRVAQKSGSTWGASIQVSDTSAKPASLALAVKGDGGVIAAWGDTRATPSAVWGAQCEAGATGVARCAAAAKLSDQTGAAVNPTVVANTTTVYLGWRDDTAGGGDIRLSRRVPS